jgi:hypothetical protein
MGSTTLTYDATSLTAALSTSTMPMPMTATVERFGVSPILAAQGTSASAFGHTAGQLAAQPAAPHAAHTTKNVVDRKADDWVLPRGRRL